jgi:predicted transposase YbfD/YdcC
MSRLLILILGAVGIFMLLPEVSADAKLTSSGQGVQADRTPSDGAQRPSQSRPGSSAGTVGRRQIPSPDRKPVHEPKRSGAKRKPGIRRKSRRGRSCRTRLRKKHRKLRVVHKRLRNELKNMKSASVGRHFASLTDKRMEKKIRHSLPDITVIAICAAVSGADGWKDMETYGKAKCEWLKTFLELPHGIPSHDTFGRVFAMICPEEFERCFLNWIQSVFEVTEGQIIPIDGKTLRRSYDRSSGKAPVHMISAWASENGITLGQVKTDDKSNEIAAIPELLKVLELEGCIVTIDAMGCQKKIAELIRDKGADYVLAVKGNQGNLYADIRLFFEDAANNDFKDIPHDYYETTDGGRGRVEIRRYRTVSDIDWLCGKENWKGIKTIGMAEYERHEGNKEISIGVRYYISSLGSDAEQFGNAVRTHWGIENSVHWILDAAFREDESRIRKDHGPTGVTTSWGSIKK